MFKAKLKNPPASTSCYHANVNFVYDVIVEQIKINPNGKTHTRFNVGVSGYDTHRCVACIYDIEEFNNKFDIVN